MTNYDVIDEKIQCPNCGGNAVICYVHWGEVKDYCKNCDLYFIYNNGDPLNTIEFVGKNYFESQEVIKKEKHRKKENQK